MPSTVIRKFHYEPDANRLVIEFQSGRVYAYLNVPPLVHSAMRNARSRGSFFNTRIRDHYPFERLDDLSLSST